MNQVNALQGLRDIHMPPPVAFWPFAVGWYLLMVLSLLFIVAIVWYSFRHIRKNRPRKAVMHRLDGLRQRYARETDGVAIAMELSSLLRRATLVAFPRRQVAGLQGDAWLHFLDDTGRTKQFTEGVGRLLVTAPYQANSQFAVDDLFELISTWVKRNVKLRK